MIKRGKKINTYTRTSLFIILGFMLAIPLPVKTVRAQSRIYVNYAVGGGDGSGLSWQNACTNITDGITKAIDNACTEIWVSAGTYFEQIDLNSGLALRGGFLGNELSLEERNFLANKTVIDGGSLGTVVDLGTNCDLDGFTIKNGNADYGGGVRANANNIIQNNTIVDNIANVDGGGIICQSTTGVTIRNNVIQNNRADHYGGGIYCAYTNGGEIAFNEIRGNSAYLVGAGICFNGYTNVSIRNNLIIKNYCDNLGGHGGGGIYVAFQDDPLIQNNVIVKNITKSSVGGGLYCSDFSSPTLINNTFAYNYTYAGLVSEIYATVDSNPTIVNCIIWDADDPTNIDANVTYTNSSGVGIAGLGNISDPPLFDDPNTGRLTINSPCVNTGNPAATYDDRDKTRNDMGAYGGPMAAMAGTDYEKPQIICLMDPIYLEATSTEGEQLKFTDNLPETLADQILIYRDTNVIAQIVDNEKLPSYWNVLDSGGAVINLEEDYFALGTNILTLEATDGYGNTSNQLINVIVQDTTPPVPVCQDITVQLDALCQVTITGEQIDNGSTDIFPITFQVDPNNFTCDDLGANPVTLTVTDENGNSDTCDATVTVEDNIDPVALGKDITVQLDAAGQAGITAAQVDDGSYDNCTFTMSVAPNSFTCADLGENTVTLTVTDSSNNLDTCQVTVTVEDNIDPVALGKDITVQLDAAGQAGITAAQVDDGSSDNCTIDSMSVAPSSFSCDDDLGENTVTLTVTDSSGNVDTCQVTVTVEDNIDPVALGKDITVQLDAAGQATITADDVNDGSYDNCSFTMSVSPNSFDCDDLDENTVTLTVTDSSGNIDTCQVTVTVEDNIDPVALGKNIIVELDADGQADITAAQVDDGSSDNCPSFTMSVSPNSFDCDDLDENTVTLTVTDSSGNVDTCQVTVTVQDKTAPEVDAGENQEVSQGKTVVLEAEATDSCDSELEFIWKEDGETLSTSASFSRTFSVGTHELVLTVRDDSGNEAEDNMTIKVNKKTSSSSSSSSPYGYNLYQQQYQPFYQQLYMPTQLSLPYLQNQQLNGSFYQPQFSLFNFQPIWSSNYPTQSSWLSYQNYQQPMAYNFQPSWLDYQLRGFNL